MGGAQPLERAAELERLAGVLAAAGNGRGQLCVIQGANGIGKSRLLEECNGLARLSGMAVIRLSMHAYYRPAGDCACTAKTLDEAVQDLGAVENIVRDFGDANPTMLSWRSLAGVIAHLAADPVRSRT